MSEEEVNSIVTDENTCPICSGPFQAPYETPCGHRYCFHCIERHLEHSSACPTCNAFIALETLIPAVHRDPSTRSHRRQAYGEQSDESVRGNSQVASGGLPPVATPFLGRMPRRESSPADGNGDTPMINRQLSGSNLSGAPNSSSGAHNSSIVGGGALGRKQMSLSGGSGEDEPRPFSTAGGQGGGEGPNASAGGTGTNLIEAMLQNAASMSAAQIGQLMQKLQEQQKRNAERADNELMMWFMDTTKEKRVKEIDQLQTEISRLTHEVDTLSSEIQMLGHGNGREYATNQDPAFKAKLERVALHAEDLEKFWLEGAGAKASDRRARLDQLSTHIHQLTKYERFECVSEISSWRQGRRADMDTSSQLSGSEQPSPPNIVTSIELDMKAELVATAGVLKQIKIFDLARLADTSVQVHFPVREIPTRAKLSSLSWNKCFQTSLICADYEGFVTLWDAETGEIVREYEEHDSKIWSVDFSRREVNYFASGSNDTTVKIWDTRQSNSVLTVQNRAQVCCVKFCPNSGDKVVFGCADTKVYCYDLHYPRQPLYTLQDHEMAASYVAFMPHSKSDEERLVTSSIDSTLKLWNIGPSEQTLIRTFRGHKNQRNFVGLSVTDQFIACGSEDNKVYTYYMGSSKPNITYPFGTGDGTTRSSVRLRNGGSDPAAEETQGAAVPSQVFVSAVSWCPAEVPTLFAANSQGTVKMLKLV